MRRFLDANIRLSRRFDGHFAASVAFYRGFDSRVGDAAAALAAGSLAVDLGAGRRCWFADGLDRSGGTRLVAVDISAEELAANSEADETRVADVARGLPFADREVDLLVSRTLLEHVEGVPGAVGHIARVLAPGGRTLHLIPCRNSLFALVARALPFSFAKRIAHLMMPDAAGVIEFETHYDHCEPGALESLFNEAGFRDVRVEVSWSQAEYFRAVFPIFVLVLAYQTLARRLGIRTLAAYAIVEATR